MFVTILLALIGLYHLLMIAKPLAAPAKYIARQIAIGVFISLKAFSKRLTLVALGIGAFLVDSNDVPIWQLVLWAAAAFLHFGVPSIPSPLTTMAIFGAYQIFNGLVWSQLPPAVRKWFPKVFRVLLRLIRIYRFVTLLLLVILTLTISVRSPVVILLMIWIAVYILPVSARAIVGTDTKFSTLVGPSQIVADDVSRMSATPVDRIFHPRHAGDVITIVQMAIKNNKTISPRGTSHSMGGQCIAPNGYIIDTRHLSSCEVDAAKRQIRVGAGATWSAVIRAANQFGLSPAVMQSYCSFSVGGTLSVNAHGITSDLPICNSVVELDIVTADGRLMTIDSDDRQPDLFRHVLGGYGLFGVITGCVLHLVPNVKLSLLSTTFANDEAFFDHYINTVLNDKAVNVKIARVDLLSNTTPTRLLVFRPKPGCPTVSDIGFKAREMGLFSKFYYKWISCTELGRQIRRLLEKFSRTPIDWNMAMAVERNLLLFESARPLSNLYTWIINVDDTFILQEYFLPFDSAVKWIIVARRLLQSHTQGSSAPSLLNCTVRCVRHDKITALPYAQGDRIAFVLYFRIGAQHEHALSALHQDLVRETLAHDGTFYLPYRRHYNSQQLNKSYLSISEFLSRKLLYDPEQRLSNSWWLQFRHLSAENQSPVSFLKSLPVTSYIPQDVASTMPFEGRRDAERRSFHGVTSNGDMAVALRERFLTEVFRIESPNYLFDIVDQSVRECEWKYGAGAKDADVYIMIQRRLKENSRSTLLSTLRRGYWAWRQVTRQRQEWVDEASHLIHQLRGPHPSLQGYLSMGDAGRTVTALANKLSIRGQRFVAHNSRGGFREKVERNSLSEVGEFVLWDPSYDGHIPIDDACVDLVTLFTGLHHVPPHRLPLVLDEICRVLRPGGIFLIREHNGTNALVPMLEVAHSLYNAVMGSPVDDDTYEPRHFRTIEEWRYLISNQTELVDAMLFSVQDFDPTVDVMMTFVKAPWQSVPHPAPQLISNIQKPTKKVVNLFDPMSSGYAVPEWETVEISKRFAHSLDVTPWYRFPFLRSLSDEWRLLWVSFRQASDRYGMVSALASSGFGMVLFMCGIYTIIAVQAAIVAVPCRLMYGDEDPDTREQIVVASRYGLQGWADGSDLGHSSARLVQEEDDADKVLSFVQMMQHLPLTKVLSSIAAYSDDAELVSLDGLDARHRVTVLMSANASAISNGGEVVLERSVADLTIILVRQPIISPTEIQAVVEVPIGGVLALLRQWPAEGGVEGWHIKQVYGFTK